MKEIVIRPPGPAPVYCSFLACRNLPARFESAEVVETYDVALLQCPFHPLNPPIVAALTKDVPAIERIAPSLAGFAEEIGWNAGNADRVQIFVKLEDLGPAPD